MLVDPRRRREVRRQSVSTPAGDFEGRGARGEALRPVLAELAGRSYRVAAQALNERGITTAEGKPWHAMQVVRVRRRLGL